MSFKKDLKKADQNVRDNPVLAHMREVAYTPVTLKEFPKAHEELIKKAEEKRLRKQERNLKNAKLNGL